MNAKDLIEKKPGPHFVPLPSTPLPSIKSRAKRLGYEKGGGQNRVKDEYAGRVKKAPETYVKLSDEG